MSVFIERFNKDTNEWVGISEVGKFSKVEQAQAVVDQLVRCGEDAPLRVTGVPRVSRAGSSSNGLKLGHYKRRYRTLMRKIEEMTHEADELYNLLSEHDALPGGPLVSEFPTLNAPAYDSEETAVEIPSVAGANTGTDGGF